ncbi:MAG: hypothetical protein NT089_09990, partial [Planctomycetia bacterium]|nr:hypothetical protein [Planctomycetia bacterium]
MNLSKIAVLLLLCMAWLSPFAVANNWGHWRGPHGNGAADAGTPPTQWNTPKNIKWKVEIPG